jgi:hypothetical protein
MPGYLGRMIGRQEDPGDKAQYQGREVIRFMENDQCVSWYPGRICVPNVKELRDKILRKAHEFSYSIHPGRNKMHHDLKATYWWYGIKRDVAFFATPIRESRLSINDPLGCCNLCEYPSGSGKILL